jgi:hypothetical protein
MKNKKRYGSRYQFNLAMNKKEYAYLKILKENYSINISGCFKRFLKGYLEKLENKKIS